MHSARCPKCETVVSRALVETMDIDAGAIFPQQRYKGVAYLCPNCRGVLSVSMDQLALNADLVDRLMKALGKG